MSFSVALTDDLETCLALRRLVFMEEQGVSEADEIDGLDPECLHLLAVVDGAPAGTARVYLDGEVAKIGRVCVLREHRGTGLGAALIEKAIEVSKGKAAQAKLGAQTHALDFYARFGFVATGRIYDDAGIPHRDMVRAL
ncbi:GNAT family N-acetyltransferase [Marimonas sp. MJW-29]|uniref:GNAT family N-acetyltransferase n=1 Tax=Sulfitobacter sediminis TaxID=3234186 RepID=A0ABV3RHD8_9RHOB